MRRSLRRETGRAFGWMQSGWRLKRRLSKIVRRMKEEYRNDAY